MTMACCKTEFKHKYNINLCPNPGYVDRHQYNHFCVMFLDYLFYSGSNGTTEREPLNVNNVENTFNFIKESISAGGKFCGDIEIHILVYI